MSIKPQDLLFTVTSHTGVRIVKLYHKNTYAPLAVDEADHLEGFPEGFMRVPNFENPGAIAYATEGLSVFSMLTEAGFKEAPANLPDPQ